MRISRSLPTLLGWEANSQKLGARAFNLHFKDEKFLLALFEHIKLSSYKKFLLNSILCESGVKFFN